MWAKNIENAPKIGVSPFVTHKIFFKNRALSLLCPCGAMALTLCKTRQVYNGPRVVKSIAAILSVHQ